jgi:hypothetical protein
MSSTFATGTTSATSCHQRFGLGHRECQHTTPQCNGGLQAVGCGRRACVRPTRQVACAEQNNALQRGRWLPPPHPYLRTRRTTRRKRPARPESPEPVRPVPSSICDDKNKRDRRRSQSTSSRSQAWKRPAHRAVVGGGEEQPQEAQQVGRLLTRRARHASGTPTRHGDPMRAHQRLTGSVSSVKDPPSAVPPSLPSPRSSSNMSCAPTQVHPILLKPRWHVTGFPLQFHSDYLRLPGALRARRLNRHPYLHGGRDPHVQLARQRAHAAQRVVARRQQGQVLRPPDMATPRFDINEPTTARGWDSPTVPLALASVLIMHPCDQGRALRPRQPGVVLRRRG